MTPQIFQGGASDGLSGSIVFSQNRQPDIFFGGGGDGVSLNLLTNQNQSPAIYSGGANDGWGSGQVILTNPSPLMYFGGANDGISAMLAPNQNESPKIYFGGVADGIASGSVSLPQNSTPDIYLGGSGDGFDHSLIVRQNSSNPLPVGVLSFGGLWFNDDALLSWELESSKNLAHFILERSLDNGANYTEISKIPPNPDPLQSAYRYSDVRAWYLPTDLLLYRLKIVDRQGKFQYSGIVKLIKDKLAPAFAAYPNPSSGSLILAVMNIDDFSGYRYELYSGNGQFLLKKELNSPHTPIDLSRYPAGFYLLKIIKGISLQQYFKITLIH